MKQESTIDPQKFQEKYDEAVNQNDATSVAKFFMDDAIFVTDAGPVYGRQAIEKWYVDMFQQLHPSNFIGKPDQNSPYVVGATGDEAWRIGEWSQTISVEGGDPIQMKGYWSTIDIRQGEDWKMRMLTWNITPETPTLGHN
jgi:ketosteroid isomerase-like protein